MDGAQEKSSTKQNEQSEQSGATAPCGPLSFVPAPGIIVWCLVPEERAPPKFPPPGPKHHPAIIQSFYKGENGEPDYIVVVPGTSQPPSTGMTYPWDFVFSSMDTGFSDSGLDHETRFTTNRLVAVPLTPDYFDECAPNYLSTDEKKKSNAVMGSAKSITQKVNNAFSVWTQEVRRRKAVANKK